MPRSSRSRTTPQARARARARAPRRPRRRLRLLWLLALAGLAVYLYSRPLAAYVETRRELEERRAEVQSLRVTKAELELRLANVTSLEATQREARRLGYVRPGETLFVVKGIRAWRAARSPTLRGSG